jgi:hypothetical protein
MKPEWRNSRDFWAGMMFFVVGVTAIFIARRYPFGSMLRMGPGYFPILLGVILILFGIYIMVNGLRSSRKTPIHFQGNWSVRALIILPLATILFGVLMERVGFVPALLVLGFGSAAAGGEFKWGEALAVTVFLTVLSVAIFIWGLGLPYSLFRLF